MYRAGADSILQGVIYETNSPEFHPHRHQQLVMVPKISLLESIQRIITVSKWSQGMKTYAWVEKPDTWDMTP